MRIKSENPVYGVDYHEDDLKIALRGLSYYCKSKGTIEDVDYFFDFYLSTVRILGSYVEVVKNSYILEQFVEMPILSKMEVEDYVVKDREINSGHLTGGLLTIAIKSIRLVNKSYHSKYKYKFDEIARSCDHIIYVMDNPELFN